MKIAWFKKVISPEIGAYLAGYSLNDKSVAKRDDLYMTGLCADDGERKVLIISFDLLGLDDKHFSFAVISAKTGHVKIISFGNRLVIETVSGKICSDFRRNNLFEPGNFHLSPQSVIICWQEY